MKPRFVRVVALLLPVLSLAVLLPMPRTLVAAQGEEVRKDLKQFTGTWQATSLERDGKAVAAQDVRKVQLIVDGEHYTLQTGRQTIEGRQKLDPSKDPKIIDAVRTKGPDKGKTIHGIYELEGETLRICFSAPEQARPTAFKTGKGGGHRLFMLKRAK